MNVAGDQWRKFCHTLRNYGQQLANKGLDHWIWVGILTTVGLILGQWIGHAQLWTDLRYKVYQLQTSMLSGEAFAKETLFVLIDDKDYWTGKPARRVPINRHYVAELLRAVDKMDPKVIALDFDFRSPDPVGAMVEHPDYECERDDLLHAILDVAKNRPVVIPKELEIADGHPVEQSDIFRGFDFSSVQENIYPGYIQLKQDLRIIPSRVQLHRDPDVSLDSFSLAVLHAAAPATYEEILKENRSDEVNLRFGKFLTKKDFDDLSVSASQVFSADRVAAAKLAHNIVIIGGKWHQRALGVGPWQDDHSTPTGHIIGAYVQGNYAEALRTGNWRPAWSERSTVIMEIFIVLGASIILALNVSVGWKIAATLVPAVVIMLLSYFLLQNLGLFFDFFTPLVIVSAHVVVEHLEWKG
jgi:CHASE2 domain-containing sensor protein